MVALIENLDKTQFNIYVIVPENGELKNYLERIGIKVFVVPLKALKPKYLLQNLKNIFYISRIIKKFRIDIVHPDHERDAFIISIVKKIVKLNLVWHVRLTRRNNLDNYNAKNANAIIAISQGAKERFEDKYHNKIHVIFNGVNCKEFKPTDNKSEKRKLLGLSENKFTILFAGQISEGKGIFDLINAIKLIELKDNLQVIFAGKYKNQEVQSKIQKELQEFNLKNTMNILGHKDNIHEYMQAADVLVLPSHEGIEGMGRVLFEAMACGTCVIGSDTSGVREAIYDGSGILVPEKNPEALKSVILELSLNSHKLNSLQFHSRRIALEIFDIKIHAKKVSYIYQMMKSNADKN